MICVSRAVLLIPSCLMAKLFSEPTHELTSIQAITDDNSHFLEFTKHVHRGHVLIWLLEHQWERHYYSYFAAEVGLAELGDLQSARTSVEFGAFLTGALTHLKDVITVWFCSDKELWNYQREFTSSSSPGSSTGKWRVFRSLGDCGRPQDSHHIIVGLGCLLLKWTPCSSCSYISKAKSWTQQPLSI